MEVLNYLQHDGKYILVSVCANCRALLRILGGTDGHTHVVTAHTNTAV